MGSAQIQGELWGTAPDDWANLQEPKHLPLWQAMIRAARVSSDTRFLDVGGGGGGASVLASEFGALVSGVDAARSLTQIARERVPQGDFRVGDMENLPFPDSSFDVVFAANSIQYAADRAAAVRELGRVCAKNGRVVVGLFGPPEKFEFKAFFHAIRSVLPEPPPGDGPFGLSMPGALESLIEMGGFSIVNSSEVSCPFNYKDFEALWRANVAAGPVQMALRSVSSERLQASVRSAVLPFQRGDGSIQFENAFRYVLGIQPS